MSDDARQRRRWRNARVWGLAAATVLAAVLLLVDQQRAAGSWASRTWVNLALLAAAFALSEYLVVHIHFRWGAFSATTSEIPLVIGLLAVPAAALTLAQVAGLLVWIVDRRSRSAPARQAFNLGQYALTVAITTWTYAALHPPDVSQTPGWLAVLAATGAGSLLSAGLILAAILVTEGRFGWRDVAGSAGFGLLVTIANSAVALLIVIVYRNAPEALPLLLVPLALTVGAYGAMTRERAQREALALLNRAGRRMTAGRDLATVLSCLVSETVPALRATGVHVILLSPSAPALHHRWDAEGERTEQACDPDVEDLLIAIAGREPSFRLEVDQAPAPLRGVVDPTARRLLVTGLHGEAGLSGVIMLERATMDNPWRPSEVAIIEALADQAAMAIRLDWVEQAAERLAAEGDLLRFRATHDALTQLANRVRLREDLVDALAERRRVHVLLIDLDGFKQVNDTFGHHCGDEVLIEAAARILGSVAPRNHETVARLGGDEFSVLLVDRDEAEAVLVADRVLSAVSEQYDLSVGPVGTVSASVGVATARSDRVDDVLQAADSAMYQAKRAGKRRVCVAEPEVRPGSVAEAGADAGARPEVAPRRTVRDQRS